MKNILIIIPLMLINISCSYMPEQKPVNVQESATPEASTNDRKPIYVYGQKSDLSRITLHFTDDPISISRGYIKLKGIISGEDPQALIEVGGKGEILSTGEKLGEYQIVSISNEEVELCLRK